MNLKNKLVVVLICTSGCATPRLGMNQLEWKGDGVWSGGVYSFVDQNRHHCIMMRDSGTAWKFIEFDKRGEVEREFKISSE